MHSLLVKLYGAFCFLCHFPTSSAYKEKAATHFAVAVSGIFFLPYLCFYGLIGLTVHEGLIVSTLTGLRVQECPFHPISYFKVVVKQQQSKENTVLWPEVQHRTFNSSKWT